MLNFVKDRGRGASPQAAEHRGPAINAKRQASGANAKVPLRKGGLAHQPQVQSAIPTRGLGNIQNSSAIIHQHLPQHRQSTHAQEKKHDPYDTDVESLDTTVNLSIVHVQDSQDKDQHHPQHRQVIDLVNESDGDEDEFEEEIDFDDYEFTPEDVQLIAHSKLQHLTREDQLAFLQQAQAQFGIIEGDSYPSTTDGNPTEWEGAPEPPTTDLHNGEGNATIPQPHIKLEKTNRSFLARSLQQGQTLSSARADHILDKPSNFSQPLTTHRDQKLFMKHSQPRGAVHQDTVKTPLTSQPPSYSQANPGVTPSVAIQSHNRVSIPMQNSRTPQQIHRPQLDSTQVQVRPHEPREPPFLPKAIHSVSAKARSVFQQQPVAEAPVNEFNTSSQGDYDHQALFAMSFDQLKQENFDHDPGAGPQVLPDDLLQKSLEERLEFAKKNFDIEKQSDFFSSLPATEWEEAGDWFLDQFQNIIGQTKDARRRKRKLAKDFENEVEERHMRVLKKQRQVEEAMNKMKKQGEGLVTKSPRPSKSPKPRRG